MCEPSEDDLYLVLGSSPSDSLQQLRQRYQQLVLLYHPDRLGSERSSQAESGPMRFLEIDAAWKILSDPHRRRQYDLQRRAQELKQDGPVDSTVCLDNMTWDQGQCVYTYSCRCGGEFSLAEEELQSQRRPEEQEHGVLVCCDSCSLSVCVSSSPRR